MQTDQKSWTMAKGVKGRERVEVLQEQATQRDNESLLEFSSHRLAMSAILGL